MNIFTKENLKIRLQNAINQINHLESIIGEKQPTSQIVIDGLKESLKDLEPKKWTADAINHNFSNAIENDLELDVNGARFVENRELITN